MKHNIKGLELSKPFCLPKKETQTANEEVQTSESESLKLWLQYNMIKSSKRKEGLYEKG